MNRFSLGSRGIAIAVATVVLFGAVMYLAGRWQAQGRAESTRGELERQFSEVQVEGQQVRDQLVAAEDRGRILLALSTLYKTALDLDQRNFGMANAHLREAEAVLGSVSATSGVVDPSRLGALRRAIEATDLNVATDLQAQRTRVLELASQLETLVSQPGQPVPDPQ